MIKSKIKSISPKEALEVLRKRNPVNRRLSEATVQNYAGEMRAGHWQLTHQGIAFDVNGNLVDGQHRLAAIIEYGAPIEMMVTTGLPTQLKLNGVAIKPMDVVDRNKVRTTGQVLTLSHGIPNGSLIAAIIRTALMSIRLEIGRGALSVPLTVALSERWSIPISRLIGIADRVNCKAHIIGPLAACALADLGKAESFFMQYVTYEDITSPVAVLRKWMENNSLKYANQDQCRVILAC